MKQPDKPSNYRWVVMGLWLFANVSGFMVMTTIGILLPAIDSDLGLSPAQQGLLSSAAFWGNVTLTIPLSWWVSRYSAERLTAITLSLETLFLFIQGWALVFSALLVGRLAFGIAVVAGHPARAILTQQWFPPREIVMVNSVSNALFGLVVGGGQVVTPFILASSADNWRATLYIFGTLFAVLTILWIVLGRERTTAPHQRREASQEVSILKGALTYRDLWITGLGFLGASLALSAFLSFFPTLMLETYNVPLQWSGALLALSILIGGIAGFGFGYLSMNTGKGKVIIQTLGLLMVVTYVGMTLTSSIPALFALSFLNGIAWGFWPILFTVSFHLPGIRPREVAIAVSFTMMMSSGGTALGPLITGFLQESLGDLRVSLMIVSFAALSLIAAGTLLRFGISRVEVERTDATQQA
jgi:MFS family permease